MLKVKTIFYFAPEQFPGLDKHFNCVHIPLKEPEKPLLDLDDLSAQVQQLMKNPETGPVFLMCVSGNVSGALAMKIVMDTNATFSKELATGYVMTKRYELNNIQPWIYQQVGPKGQKKKVTPLVEESKGEEANFTEE